MAKRPITRRTAFSLLLAVPVSVRLGAQVRSQALRRVFPAGLHNLILEPDGTMRAWTDNGGQSNNDGELGLGHKNPVAIDTVYSIPGLRNVVTAAAGYSFSIAVLADGQVVSWGRNMSGQLGTWPPSKPPERAGEAYYSSYSPTPVSVRIDAVSVSAGDSHVLALSRDGSVYAWGDGMEGHLGVGDLPTIQVRTNAPYTLQDVPYPLRVPGLTGATAIAAGRQHSLALLKDGTVRAWGFNEYGQLGDGTRENRTSPVLVKGVSNAVAVAAGFFCSVALLADGRVMTWGGYGAGGAAELGRKASGPLDPIPGPADGVRRIRAIAAGRAHVLALTDAGTVVSWGYDGQEQTGQGRSGGTGDPVPKSIAGLSNVDSIAASAGSSFAVLSNGKILIWGGVPLWNRPGGKSPRISPNPMPLSLTGLANP
jgi:alpha-tubulin suppressor-like RCC1 family protein